MPRVTSAPPEPAAGRRDGTIESAARAARLLRVLMRHPRPRSVAELSEELGLHKATLVRLLHTLVAEGVVVQDPETKRYGWSPAKLLHLVQFASPVLDFSEAAQRVLDDLAAGTGATAMLVLPDAAGRHGSAIMASLPQRLVRLDPRDEPPRPLHTIAAGKCYLAHLSEPELERYIGAGLERLTPRTIASSERLRREVRRIRSQGYALNQGELTPDTAGVAVALCDLRGRLRGALAAGYPLASPPGCGLPRLVVHLRTAVDAIADSLSYEWWAARLRERGSPDSARRRPPESPDPGFGNGAMPAVRSAARTVRIVVLLLSQPEGMPVREVARRRGLNPATALRLLRTLEREGLLAQDVPAKGYRIDPLGWTAAAPLLRSAASLAEAAQGVLQRLAEATGGTATLAAPDAAGRQHVDLLTGPSRRLVRVVLDAGISPPLHATSGGKCYLAWQPRRRLEAYMRGGLPSWRPATITSPAILHRELALVREQGYALNREEADAGIGAMAVPLRGLDGSVVGAVTVWSMIADLSAATVGRWLPLLRATADELAALLVPGWRENIARGG